MLFFLWVWTRLCRQRQGVGASRVTGPRWGRAPSSPPRPLFLLFWLKSRVFPAGSDSKEPTCNAGEPGSIPGLGRSPGEGNGNALQYSCLENFVKRGYRPWNHKQLDVTEQRTHFTVHYKDLAFYKLNVCSNLPWIKSINAIFLAAFAHIISHIFANSPIYRLFHYYYSYSDLWWLIFDVNMIIDFGLYF